MKIVNVRWHTYRVPFIHGFRTAHGTLTERSGMFVELCTDQGITGMGEIAPLPEFAGSGLSQVRAALPGLAAQLQGQRVDQALPSVVQLAEGEEHHASLCCGLEMALLDALGKYAGKSVATLLALEGNTPKTRVAVNAVIGGASIEAVVQATSIAVSEGYRCVKLKVGMCNSPEEELARIAVARGVIGPERQLRLDANEAWTMQQAYEVLSRCAPYRIQYIEQPVPAHQLEHMRLLRRLTSVPIAADEALRGLSSARRILDSQAADVLVIKPQLMGGLSMARRVIQEAAECGVQAVLTSTLETGVGIAATLHLAAAMPQVTMACGLSTLSLLAKSFLIQDLLITEGSMHVPEADGLGITVDYDTHAYSS